MKRFLFLFLCIFIPAVGTAGNAWASEGLPQLYGSYWLVFFGLFLIFILSSIEPNGSADKEIYRRIQDNLLGEFDGERDFEFRVYKRQWFRLLCALAFTGMAFALFMRLSAPDDFTRTAFNVIMLSAMGIGVWGLSIVLRIPLSLKVTQGTIFIKRFWPLSSPAIHLYEIAQFELRWVSMEPAKGRRYSPVNSSSLGLNILLSAAEMVADRVTADSTPKMVEEIYFTLNNGEKHSLRMTSFGAAAVEKLVHFLKQAGVRDCRAVESGNVL